MGLQIGKGVPVRLEKDHRRGRLKVESETTRTRCQQEQKVVAFRVVPLVNRLATLVHARISLKTKDLVPAKVAVVLHDIHQIGRLEENQRLVVGRLELWQNTLQVHVRFWITACTSTHIQKLKLARHANHVLIHEAVGIKLILDLVKEIRVVAEFPQLHNQVLIHLRARLAFARNGQTAAGTLR